MLDIFYCQYCHEELIKYGELSLHVYDEIVKYYLMHGKSKNYHVSKNKEDHRIVPVLEFLEKKNYIVTTEIDLNILTVKPQGINHRFDKNDEKNLVILCFCDTA